MIEPSEPITVKEFLEDVPPGRQAKIKELASVQISPPSPYSLRLNLPDIELHCENKACRGKRFFECKERPYLYAGKRTMCFVTYVCKNCEQTTKTFALLAYLYADEKTGELYKFGEVPAFGPPTPPRLVSLLGDEKDYFFKGRRAENQGLGIAAFAYYRRVIENQKNKILDEIIRVSEKIGVSGEILTDLRAARGEDQFTKVVAAIKHGIPEVLMINGQNPLTLLHSALSEGLHAQTDEECLELATSIRVVMTELAERLSQALKDEAELNKAVKRLAEAKGKQDKTPRTEV